MKKILILIITVITALACSKDKSPFELLESEKNKVDQAYINNLLVGKWYGKTEKGLKIYLEFYPNRMKFVEYYMDPNAKHAIYSFDTGEYFFIKNDDYPNVYKLVTLSNKKYEGQVCYTMFKIIEDEVYHYGIFGAGEVDVFVNEDLAYKFDIFNSSDPYDIMSIIKLKRTK